MGPGTNGERFYVTGTSGALGAWVVKMLLEARVEVFVDTIDDRELRLLVSPALLASVQRLNGSRVEAAGITHVVYTHSLSDAVCLDDPAGSALAAIGGFADTLRASASAQVEGVAFESSMAVFAPAPTPLGCEAAPSPVSLRGSLQLSQEILARRACQDLGLAIWGLRTGLVYGPGQDADLDGGASAAIASAIADRAGPLTFNGQADFQFVGDVAGVLIDSARSAGRSEEPPHLIRNLRGTSADASEFAQLVAHCTGTDTVTGGPGDYPLPRLDDACGIPLQTALEAGIRTTAEILRWAPRDLYSWT